MLLVYGALEYFPVAFVFLVGLFLAIGHRERHPQVSLLAGISFFLLGLIHVFWKFPYLYILAEGIIEPHRCVLIDYVFNLLIAGICILILVAIFGWRKGGGAEDGLEDR
jgi:hypothetical protein